jgi:hypothetical protein
MMEMGSMPGGSFPPPGVLCSVKSDHDLCSESIAFLYRKEVESATSAAVLNSFPTDAGFLKEHPIRTVTQNRALSLFARLS